MHTKRALPDPTNVLAPTDDYSVDYEWVADGDYLVLRRMVWTKAYRRTDRKVVHQADGARILRADAPTMLRDLGFAMTS